MIELRAVRSLLEGLLRYSIELVSCKEFVWRYVRYSIELRAVRSLLEDSKVLIELRAVRSLLGDCEVFDRVGEL